LLEMRPNGQTAIQIAHPGDKAPSVLPFEKWSDGPFGFGAGFSYEDFLEPQYFWPGQTIVEKAMRSSRECDVLKSTPGAAERTHYAEIRSWLDRTIGFPVYVEKTLKETGPVKEYTYFGLRQNGGVWSAKQIEAKVRGQAGSTLLIIERGSPKANLGLKDFSTAQITHFQDGP
jgi:Outer membrane lipoprotein-sorting protein